MNLDGDYYPTVGLNVSAKNECKLAKGVKKKAKAFSKSLFKQLRAQCTAVNNELRACKAAKGGGDCDLKIERGEARQECEKQRYDPWGGFPICSWT